MSIQTALPILLVSSSLCGCELLNLIPRSTVSATDVACSRKGGPSAEMLISEFSITLTREAKGETCPPAWRTYREYWIRRMEYLKRHETRAYYERVWRDFPQARNKLNLEAIEVLPYD